MSRYIQTMHPFLEKRMRKILLAAAVLMTSATAFLPAQANAQVGVSIVVGNAPPPPRYEVLPPPRYGYIWIPGYWNWDRRHHVWNPGYWERTRAGYFYEAPRWYQGPGGWRLDRGGWYQGDRTRWEYEHRRDYYNWHEDRRPPPPPPRHDRDRDGIPDRHDHNNSLRSDRDRDGVPDRHDSRPDNPGRN
jgi:hypothetical protein